MKKNILYFLAGVVLTTVIGLIFINVGKKGENTNNQVLPENAKEQVSLEDKEQCMKYYDKYRDYLVKEYEGNIERGDTFEYEMFYNSELDTCISAYSIQGHVVHEGELYEDSFSRIVDYLNGEKELYRCRNNTYLGLGENEDCILEWNVEKEKYKS